jgi:hypothetical protein
MYMYVEDLSQMYPCGEPCLTCYLIDTSKLFDRHFDTCDGYAVLDVRDNKKRTMPSHEA